MSAKILAEFERSITEECILASHEREKAEGKSIGRPLVINGSLKTSGQFMREQDIGIKKLSANSMLVSERFTRRSKGNI